jgi:hypothetical protein
MVTGTPNRQQRPRALDANSNCFHITRIGVWQFSAICDYTITDSRQTGALSAFADLLARADGGKSKIYGQFGDKPLPGC